MGASKFLQKKANTRAKEIDKKYGEGQYGGTWWQDMVKNNAEMGESPSESFLQRKMKEINSARTVKPESTQNVVSGSGAQKDKKFDAGQYAEDVGKLFLNGVAEGVAATGAAVENWIGKGLDKLFPGAGFEGSGLFNVLYNGRPDWKWAGENGLVGIKQDREYNQESLQENAERIDGKVMKKAAEFGGDIAYGLGNAAPMAATAMLTGGASSAAALTKEGLLKTGAEVVEKSGVLNSMSQAARDMLTSRDYWTSFASEVGMDYYDALDSGATEDEALRYALSSAGLNSVIEIGGGIQKIPEKPTFRTWLKSAHEEGMEEIQQGVVSRLLENMVYNKGNPIASVTDENAVLNPVTALGEYAGGAAVGGILSGGQQLAQRGINNAQYKRAYETSAQDLVKESLEINPGNALATKLQKKLEDGKKLTGSELRQLVEQNEIDMVDGDRATIQTAAEARLTELGETENVPQVAEAIARQAVGERITDAEKTLLEGSERARQVRQELNPENIRVGATDEEWTGQIGTARVNRAAYNRGIQENGVTGAKYNAETGKLDAIVKDDQGKIKTVPAEKAELSPLQEELFDWATDLGEAGPVLVSAYRQTQNLETYARQFHNAYEYGKAGVPMDYVNKSQAASYLNTTQREIAYEEGAKAHQRELQGRQEKKRSGGTVDSSTKKKPTVSLRGATVGGVKYAPVNKKAMDGRQWASVGTMKAFAQATGVNVVFYESQANERGEYEGANGFYKNGTLYLDINAGRDRVAMGETAILKTAAHEITHYIKEGSPEQYEVLKNFVVEKLTREKGISFDDLVTDKQRREPGLSYGEAVDEVVADACEMMLKDSKAVEQLARENRSLAERIRQWIRKWVRSLKAAMEGLTADRPESRAMMQYAQELQEIWDNALVDAARNGQGTESKTRYSYSGVRAKTANRSALQKAVEMRNQEKSNEEIRKETGWFVGMDGKWRFEISDADIRFDAEGDLQGKNKNDVKTLADYISHDKLFEAYPDLAEVPVYFAEIQNGSYGSYSRGLDEITLNRSLMEDPKELLDTLVHEVQHAIQERERFAPGASKAYWNRRLEEGGDVRTRKEKQEVARLQKELDEMKKSDPEFVADMEKLNKMAPSVSRGAINWDTLEQIEPDPPEWVAFDKERDQLEEKYGDRIYDWFFLRDQIEMNRKNREWTPGELYYNTAGEIEARDSAARRTLTEAQRKEKTPNLGNDNTVFVEDGVWYSVRENFSKEIDSWVKDDMPEGVRFTMGSTGPVMQGLGAIESDIYMEGDKIKKIVQDHPEMTLAEIKKVPQILEDPALILKSEGRGKPGANSRLVCFGLTKAQNGQPVMTVMDLRPRENGFVVDDMQKVNSAYTKNNPMAFIQKSDVVYADKKRAIPLLRTTGLTISSQRLLRNGYIGSISYKGSSVNIEGVPFSSVVKMEASDKVQNSMRDSMGRELTEAQQEYFKDSKVRDADGNLLVMYHQTDGTFTVFDTKHKGAGAGDDETPFGIFLKRTSRNIGVRGEKQMELYADIRNPLRVRDRTELVSKLRELSVDYARLKDESAQIDKEYGAKFEEAKNAFKSFLIQWRKNNPDAPPRAAYDADGFDAAFNAEDNAVKEWTHAKDELALRAKTSITQALRDNGYDGVILENDKGSWGRSTDAYIALDANQVKNTTNKTPTADPDIRYQQRDNLKEEYHLTDDEESAIISYKSGDSYTLNGKLTARAELTEYQRKLRDNLDAALEKLPVYRGEVYRHYNFEDFGGFEAMRDFLSLFKNGRHIELGGYLSCSIMRNEDRTKGKYTVNMVIQSENGRRLAGFGRNTENEILLPRNTRLVPYQMERMGPTSIRIYVREETISETGKANDSTLPGVLQVREGTQRGKDLQQVSGGDSGKVQSEMGRFVGRDGNRGGMPGLREGEGSRAMDPSGVAENYGRTGTRGGEGEKIKSQQRDPRLSDRAVLEWAAEMALRDKSKSWTAEDREQLERFRNRMRMLQDTQAEMEALKEERKILLAGRKVSEITGEERTEVSKNKNRIDIAKNKAERYEAAVWELESKAAIKTLLKKSRSIVETEASYQARKEYRERQEEREMVNVTRRKVERNAKRLLEYMNTNTDKKHIPEALKKPIGELLESLNFFSNSARRGGYTSRADLKYYEAMQGLQAALATQRAFDDTGEGTDVFKGYLDLPAGFESLLAVHVERVKNVVEKHPLKTDVLKMMDLGDLRDLDVILSVMSRSVTKMNEMFIKRRFAYVADAAEDSIFAMQRLGQHQDKPGERFALWDNTLPWYAFQRFGEGGKAVFEGLQDGWDKMAFNMKTILDFKQGLISDAQARKWDTETHKVELTDPDGSAVTATLTTAQLMSLYCLSKRKQALGHLLGGGIRPDAIEVTNTLGDKIKKKKWSQDKQFKLTEESLGQLLKLLTPEQIKVADAMQKFMTEQGSAWGNAISMERFGYRAFTEQNYFPIETDRQDREAKTGDAKEGSLYRLQNISAVKPLVKNANNALILRGIFDVFANHTADMAKYNAMVLPIIDAQKWYNYRYGEKNEAGQVYTRTVQRAMTKAYGKVANNFIIKYLQDLNGVKENGDRGDTIPKRMISNYKRAMVAANMRVAILQPTAYVRASAVLDYKYLLKAFKDKTGTKQATKEMMENSGIALWKSLGFFDTDVGRSIRDQIKGKSSKIDDLVDKTMVPAEKGDEVTWARLWRACKLEVQDKQHLTGEELLNATAERFREVIYRTQVVDSTMTRSHAMRGSGTLTKMATSFMSEPTVSYNMVMESTRQIAEDAKRMGMRTAIRRNWKTAGRAYQAYIVSAIVTAIVESLYDALRDSDDDKYLDKVWKALGGEKPETVKDGILDVIFGLNGNLAGDINPIGKVPYLRDVVSILGGYSNGRMDTEAVANLKKAIDIWDEVIRLQTGDLDKATKTTYYGNMTTYGMIYPTAKALSQLTGLPGSAAMREVATAWNTTVGTMWPALKMRTYEDKKLREAWENYGKDSGVSYAVMYRAIQDLKEIESDRDADGNAISGSLKAKYVEYIRGMGLTRAQEKAVWEAAKNSSWSDKGTPWG